MLESKEKERYLLEARSIGDQLLDISEESDCGIFWYTYGVEKNNTVTKNLLENIVLGTSGPTLFFIELFKQTKDQKYLEAAIAAAQWLVHYCNDNPSDFYSFNTGRMGVALTLQKMSKISGDLGFLKESLKIAASCDDFFNDPRLVSTWNNGASGTLVALLHLHNETGEAWLLEKAARFASYLLDEALMGRKGLYWDRSHQNINGLCGFSSGVSGVAFAFLELSRYISNEAFFWLANQAFLYESQYFNSSIKNWQDLRKVFRKFEDFREHRTHLLNGNIDFFTNGAYENSWSYGAAGIGMARLRAFELSSNETLALEARMAIDTVLAPQAQNRGNSPLYVLAEGGSGSVDLLLKAASVLDDPSYYSHAKQIADAALDQKHKTGSYNSALLYKGREGNNSLFLGTPGIGYMYLRLIDPNHVPSVLQPEVKGPGLQAKYLDSSMIPEALSLTLPEIKRRLLSRYYSGSIELADQALPSRLNFFFEREEIDFFEFIGQEISSVSPEYSETLRDLLNLEQKKRQLELSHSSHVMLHVKELVRKQKAEKWNQKDSYEIEEGIFVLDSDLEFYESTHSGEAFLLKPTAYGIVENHLSLFSYAILQSFISPTAPRHAIANIMELFEELDEDGARLLREKILEQIKAALLAGLIIDVG